MLTFTHVCGIIIIERERTLKGKEVKEMKEHIAKVRETMVEQVARKYGLESGVTISFAVLVEQEDVKQEWIAEMYETLMN